VKIFLDWIKRIWNRSDKTLSQTSKTYFVLFYGYETISLKLYLEIVNTLDFKRLIVSGEADELACAKQWDLIIQKNYQTNGGHDYLNFVDSMKSYGHFLSEYNLIKATLLKLISLNLEVGIVIGMNEVFIQDDELIADLRNRGYRIDTTDKNTFCDSLNKAMQRSEHLVTRMKMKANEINEMMKDNGGSQAVSFEEIIANLSFMLGFELPDTLTLARYNEYKKILKERNSKREAVNGFN